MTLYSSPTGYHSHRTRLVLAEKNIGMDLVSVQDGRFPEDLIDLNPYHSLPTLAERDLVLYDSRVICEYLDERFPHPPLMPVDPVSRAKTRLALHRIERDWYPLVDELDRTPDRKAATRARKQLEESIVASADVFAAQRFFLSDEFSLIDCSIAPILWRLPYYGIGLKSSAQAVRRYMDLIFSRRSFRDSLSDAEQEMR
ncbi:MAG: stringent starvation protein A [Gammaproteobacteria bacterium]|nr:stringent starvation protein A [Gammaproteobacteria bacterium]